MGNAAGRRRTDDTGPALRPGDPPATRDVAEAVVDFYNASFRWGQLQDEAEGRQDGAWQQGFDDPPPMAHSDDEGDGEPPRPPPVQRIRRIRLWVEASRTTAAALLLRWFRDACAWSNNMLVDNQDLICYGPPGIAPRGRHANLFYGNETNTQRNAVPCIFFIMAEYEAPHLRLTEIAQGVSWLMGAMQDPEHTQWVRDVANALQDGHCVKFRMGAQPEYLRLTPHVELNNFPVYNGEPALDPWNWLAANAPYVPTPFSYGERPAPRAPQRYYLDDEFLDFEGF